MLVAVLVRLNRCGLLLRLILYVVLLLRVPLVRSRDRRVVVVTLSYRSSLVILFVLVIRLILIRLVMWLMTCRLFGLRLCLYLLVNRCVLLLWL